MNAINLPYDLAIPLNALQAYQILDSDNDQSGLALYTADGVTFTAAWGEDPALADTATPSMDVGYVLEPRCLKALIFANDDYRLTLINTPVVIDVPSNDTGYLTVVDPTSVSTSGLLQPANGTIVVNPNGTITYTPNPGFTGVDEFEYIISSVDDPNLTDIATVRVAITCSVANAGENDILGSVFIDNNLDADYGVGESGQSGVTVNLYDGNNAFVDSAVTDASGNYAFSVTLPPKESNDFVAFGIRVILGEVCEDFFGSRV